MPTSMHVYKEIAERHGVNSSSREALDRFYNHDISALSQEEQLAIAQELYDREGEPNDARYVTRFWGHLVSSSQTLISRLIGR